MAAELAAEERTRLNEINAALTPEELASIAETQRALKEMQVAFIVRDLHLPPPVHVGMRILRPDADSANVGNRHMCVEWKLWIVCGIARTPKRGAGRARLQSLRHHAR